VDAVVWAFVALHRDWLYGGSTIRESKGSLFFIVFGWGGCDLV